MNRWAFLVPLVAVLVGTASGVSACRDSTSSLPFFMPSAATPTDAPPPGPIPANAKVVTLGQPNSGILRGSDPPCPDLQAPEDELAGSPCQPFQVTAPATGFVVIVVASQDPSQLPCTLYSLGPDSRWVRYCATSAPRVVQMPVLGGQPYPFGVEFEKVLGHRLSPDDAVRFTVSASFSTSAAATAVGRQ